MKTINSGQFLRLHAILEDMVACDHINKEEADAFLAKTGYVQMGESKWQSPDGSMTTEINKA